MAVYFLSFVVLSDCFLAVYSSHHWIVTESGKIQTQIENTAFPLRRPFDLMGLLEQEKKLTDLRDMYQTLLKYKKSIDVQWSKIEVEGDLENRLYTSDVDCIQGGKPLAQHDLNMEFVDYGNGSRPKMRDGAAVREPNCQKVFPLDFSMMTYPHLQTLNRRANVSMSLTASHAAAMFDLDVAAMFKNNASDWSAFNLASAYWRIVGNGTNALECSRRAVYLAPRHERHIALLNLGTLLQQVQSLGEAAIVLHSAVDHKPAEYRSHMALGNVYVALGDHVRSLACFDNVLSLRPGHVQALQLKHALLCHKKFETGLVEIHTSLQNILQELQQHHDLQEKWLLLQNQVAVEKQSGFHHQLFHTVPVDLHLLLRNVEDQAKILKAEVISKVNRKVAPPIVLAPPPPPPQQVPKIEKNQLKTESVFDCDVEKCPVYVNPAKTEDSASKANIENMGLLEIPENLLKNKMESLINLMKSINYDSNFDVADFKGKVKQQIEYLKQLKPYGGFSVDQSLFLSSFESCISEKVEQNIKDISKCFVRVFDRYSTDVSSRIQKLKERIKYMNQVAEVKQKKVYYDESTLENYVENDADIFVESVASTDACKNMRDGTEL